MARRRNKRSASDELANFLVEAVAALVKYACIGVAYLLKYAVLAVWAVLREIFDVLFRGLRSLWHGIKWVAAKNKEESIRLDARRRERWEERWARWTHEDETEEDEEDVEETDDILPELIEMPKAVEEPAPIEDEEDIDEEDPKEVEKEIKRQAKRLETLRNREDKMREIHSATEEEWEKYTRTVSWRSLQWDIRDAEMRLEYLERTA